MEQIEQYVNEIDDNTKQFASVLNKLPTSEDNQDNITLQDIINKNEIATDNSVCKIPWKIWISFQLPFECAQYRFENEAVHSYDLTTISFCLERSLTLILYTKWKTKKACKYTNTEQC